MENPEKNFVISALRRASLRWPARTKAKQEARVERGKYRCAGCGNIARAKDVSVDHRECVVDPATGFQDWNTYIERLFCGQDNLQVLCRECHDAKSKGEMAERAKAKAAPRPTNARKRKPTKRARKNRPRKNLKELSPEPPQELS